MSSRPAEGEQEGSRGEPASPGIQASGPLAGTVRGLLYCVGYPGGVGGTEELHRATLQPHLTAALAEAGIGVDVVVVDAGRRAPPVTRHQVHLGTNTSAPEPGEWLPPAPPCPCSAHLSTHRGVAPAVILADGHADGHLLAGAPVFLT